MATEELTNQQPETTTKTEVKEVVKEKIVYPEEYVKELRNEAAMNRVKAKQTEDDHAKLKGEYEILLNKHNAVISARKEEIIKSFGLPEDKIESYRKMDLDALELISKDFAKPILNSLGAEATTATVNLPKSMDDYMKLPMDEQNRLFQKYPTEINKLLNLT